MTTDPREALAELVAEVAERFALDPGDVERRVRRQLARRAARGSRPFKVCPTCDEWRPALDFAEDVSKPDGLRRVCRGCDRARVSQARPTHVVERGTV